MKALVEETVVGRPSRSAMKTMRIDLVGMGDEEGVGWETAVLPLTIFVAPTALAGLVRMGKSERLGWDTAVFQQRYYALPKARINWVRACYE